MASCMGFSLPVTFRISVARALSCSLTSVKKSRARRSSSIIRCWPGGSEIPYRDLIR